MRYKIVQKKDHSVIYASGFYRIERAKKWLNEYDPKFWDDKNILSTDLEIIEDPQND